MSRNPYPSNFHVQRREAWPRLRRLFPGRNVDWPPPAGDIVERVEMCVVAHQPDDPLQLADRVTDAYPKPSGQDAADALQWIGNARRSLDLYELRLIDHAVSCGVTWEAVGRALGWDGATAAADARRHRSRLAKKLNVAGGPV